MNLVPSILRTHVLANNTNLYTPAFVNQDNRDPAVGEVGGTGYYTPIYFGVHNPSATGITVTVWTTSQGTSGAGASIYIGPGDKFYAKLSKVLVGTGATVVLLGVPYTPNLI